MRICSFLPSATEILYAVGLGEAVVGVSYACDFPPEARQKPVVVRTRLEPTADGAAMDGQVSEFVARGQSLYQVDLETLAQLAPDLILTQDLCQVCAASPGDLAEALTHLPRPPRVLSLTPNTLADVFNDIRRVGEAAGRTAAAAQLAAKLEASVAEVQKLVTHVPDRPRVLCLEWLSPPYVGGHWVPQMVERAGGTDVLGQAGVPSRRVAWEEVLAGRPDVIVVIPCGYDLAETLAEMRRTELPADWEGLPAVRAGRVFAADANSYFSRPGPRLVTGLRLLAWMFHPQLAAFALPAGCATRV